MAGTGKFVDVICTNDECKHTDSDFDIDIKHKPCTKCGGLMRVIKFWESKRPSFRCRVNDRPVDPKSKYDD